MFLLTKLLLCLTLAQSAQASAWLEPSEQEWASPAPTAEAPVAPAEAPDPGTFGGELESESEPALHVSAQLVAPRATWRDWAVAGPHAMPEGYRPGPHRPPTQR